MTRAPLTADQANAVWDLLVEHAGASEYGRTDFVFHQTDRHQPEYRFVGALGFGGKFYRDSYQNGVHDAWLVSCYREDETPARRDAIDATNAALVALRRTANI